MMLYSFGARTESDGKLHCLGVVRYRWFREVARILDSLESYACFVKQGTFTIYNVKDREELDRLAKEFEEALE